MKRDDIVKGGRYLAKVSGRLVTVRVLDIRDSLHRPSRLRYDVVNESTGRKTTFVSAARFRRPVGG